MTIWFPNGKIFTEIFRDFFKYHNLPEFKRTLTKREWRNLHYSLGRKYARRGFTKTGFLETGEFRLFTTFKNFPFWQSVFEGVESINQQTGLDFKISNMMEPILINRKRAEDIILYKKLRDRKYGALLVLDFHDLEIGGYKVNDPNFVGGTANLEKGFVSICVPKDNFSNSFSNLTRLVRITTSHEISHMITPYEIPHCNDMSWSGVYIAGDRYYHKKRCLLNTDNETYVTLCPSCLDMAKNFVRGYRDGLRRK